MHSESLLCESWSLLYDKNKYQLIPGPTRLRVEESSNSRTHLTMNSHALEFEHAQTFHESITDNIRYPQERCLKYAWQRGPKYFWGFTPSKKKFFFFGGGRGVGNFDTRFFFFFACKISGLCIFGFTIWSSIGPPEACIPFIFLPNIPYPYNILPKYLVSP